MLTGLVRLLLAPLLLAVLTISAAAQSPSYELDSTSSHVVRLSNLSSSDDCRPATISGRVVRQEFDRRGLRVQGVVVEQTGGDRVFVNVDQRAIDSPRVNMIARGWIVSGLQAMLAEGQRVRLGIKVCGAAGRVAFVDEVASAAAPPPSTPIKYGPSFDCTSKAATTQALARTICRDGDLSYWELAYVIAYQAVREAASPEMRKAMVDEANALVVRMNEQCQLPSFPSPGFVAAPSQIACVRSLFQENRLALIRRADGDSHAEAILSPPDTVAIQLALQLAQHLPSTATIDGVFGPVTRTAIMSWQREHGLRATGFGSAALLKAMFGPPAQAPSPSIPETREVAGTAPDPGPAIDRTGKTGEIKLALSDGKELRPQDVFEQVSGAVYVVKTPTSLGSAVAISARELLTNCHVVEAAAKVGLEHEGRQLSALVVSANKDADRCVLRIANSDRPMAVWVRVRPYADVKVGERVFSVGSPKGLELTLAEGMISSKRALAASRLFQTSAPISPGSSGGGLFDAQGHLVGITTFMLKDAQNLNFAIAAEEYAK